MEHGQLGLWRWWFFASAAEPRHAAFRYQVQRDQPRWRLDRVYKDPATDRSKASIGGHGLSLVDRAVDHSGDYTTVVTNSDSDAYGNELDVVLLDGDLKREQDYNNVWETARKYDRYVEEAQEAYA